MTNSLIAIDASPNTTKKDRYLTLKQLISPWSWSKSNHINKLQDYFNENYNTDFVVITQNGRLALFLLLKSILEPNDEVITQAFTCIAVPNSITWAGGKVIFSDIDKDTYNIDPEDVKKKINKNTKAIIVQHTFGIPAAINEIRKICRENNIYLIEDCAHALGAKYDNKLLGTFGDAAIFSFNQDKVVSGVNGGALIINNQELVKKYEQMNFYLDRPGTKEIFKSLLHPLVWSVASPLYELFGIGKGIVFISWKLGILGNTITPVEQEGKKPSNYLKTMSNPQAKLVLNSLERLNEDNKKRLEISDIYFNELKKYPIIFPKIDTTNQPIYLRFPIQIDSTDLIFKLARRKGIILGKWYSTPIFPQTFKTGEYYKYGTCKIAEEVGRNVVNLPTYPRLKNDEIYRIINTIKEYYEYR